MNARTTAAITCYFVSQSAVVDGKSCRHYRGLTPENQPLCGAHLFRNSFRSGPVWFGGSSAEPDYLLKMRKSFALSGKIDVVDARTETLRGIVTRGRKIFNADERLLGRFIDPRTWKEHFGETLIDAVGEALFGGESTAHSTDGPHQFVLTVEKRPVGTLGRTQLPFFPDPPRRTEPHAVGRVLKKFLPKKLGSALFDITPPIGWKFEVTDLTPFPDPHLLLAAALMTAEISRW